MVLLTSVGATLDAVYAKANDGPANHVKLSGETSVDAVRVPPAVYAPVHVGSAVKYTVYCDWNSESKFVTVAPEAVVRRNGFTPHVAEPVVMFESVFVPMFIVSSTGCPAIAASPIVSIAAAIKVLIVLMSFVFLGWLRLV